MSQSVEAAPMPLDTPPPPTEARPQDTSAGLRFAFGQNWQRYLLTVDEERISEAARALTSMLRVPTLAQRSFLDAGCGSGLMSLAAVRLGAARVHGFDFDDASVACARAMKARFAPDAAQWTIERGDVLDAAYTDGLGRFDVVYSWGVLHHTGRMWEGIAAVERMVAPGGLLFLAIYNDRGRRSRMWRELKRTYNQLPAFARTPYAVAVMLPSELRVLLSSILARAPGDFIRAWTRPATRGMSHWHDLIDWVGGYPFEVARPEEVFDHASARGFRLRSLKTSEGGCNEFVFERA